MLDKQQNYGAVHDCYKIPTERMGHMDAIAGVEIHSLGSG